VTEEQRMEEGTMKCKAKGMNDGLLVDNDDNDDEDEEKEEGQEEPSWPQERQDARIGGWNGGPP